MSIAVIIRDPWIRPGWVRLITEAVAAAQTAEGSGLSDADARQRARQRRTEPRGGRRPGVPPGLQIR